MKYPRVFVCLLLLVSGGLLHAQVDAPLLGPLLAATSADQDSILLYDVGAGTTRTLIFGAGYHQVWGFSPDGCRIAFTLSDEPEGLARLYTAQLDGSEVRELVQYHTQPPANWGVWSPRWGAEGIAFVLIETEPLADGTEARSYHIARVSADGGAPERYSVTGDEHEPEWSPDGRWLAYISYTERVPGADISSTAAPTPEGAASQPSSLLREADLWVVSSDGASKYRLTDFPTGSVRAPRWSPDGDLIGFTYSPSPGNDQFWMIGSQPNSIPTQLSYQWSLILDTTWLPDSTAMLSAVRDFHGQAENRLWRIPLVGNADNDATLYVNDPALSYADYPRFSADGRWLALRSAYALALMDTSSQTWTLLGDLNLGNLPAVWSPAGFAGEAACQKAKDCNKVNGL